MSSADLTASSILYEITHYREYYADSKGLNTDLVRLECCDFSFTISHIAREPFIHCDLHIEAVAEPG